MVKLRSSPGLKPSDDLLADLANRLTDRDRWLCRMLWDHRVLTSDQIRQLAFDSSNAAQHRLLILHRLRVLDRFRPHRRTGSAPFHYVLGPMGAAVLAAEQGIDPSQFGYRRDKTLGLAHNQRLAHIVGVNGFFAALAAAARHRPDGELVDWWSERRCASRWGEIVRPDGWGRWRQADAQVCFFLEYDRATERIHRVTAKLDGYADLATAGVPTLVLIWLPGPRREAELRKLLNRAPVPVATAHPIPDHSPADAVWLPTGTTHTIRQPLTALPTQHLDFY